MAQLVLPGGTFEVDDDGYLLRFEDWTESFAEGLAPQLEVTSGLSDAHWRVLHFVRHSFQKSRTCPTVYQTSEALGLDARELATLFPAGYARGACRLAGVTFRQGYYPSSIPTIVDHAIPPRGLWPDTSKRYTTDVYGCLFYPDEWDENFATCRAREIGIEELTAGHWSLIRFVRHFHAESGRVPTIGETTSQVGVDLDQLAHLFDAGYHRGLLKVAGLRI